jgi:hypothetical protein
MNLDLVAYAEFWSADPNATNKYKSGNRVELTFAFPEDYQYLTVYDQDALHIWKTLPDR